jgi:hypothetical protein
MAMTISGSTGVTYPDGSSQSSGQQACKAWVNFNGTGTVAIRASFNVTSITDRGTGLYTVNLTNALSDANYSVVGSAANSFSDTERNRAITPVPLNSSSCYINAWTDTGSASDVEYAFASIFR